MSTENIVDGYINIYSGASSYNDDVRAGGIINQSGGVLSGAHIAAQGTLNITSGQTINPVIDSGAKVTASSGAVVIAENATVNSVTLLNGATETVKAGGIVTDTIVSAGAIQNILSGGSALDNAVSQSGTVNVQGGGLVSGGVVSGYWAVVNVSAAGVASGVTLTGAPGGLLFPNNMGTMNILSGGTAVNNIVDEYGLEYVSAGGTTISALVQNGGLQTVYSGGMTSGLTLANGGSAVIMAGGAGSNVVVSGGGTNGGGNLTVQSGGIVTNINVAAGGSATFNAGATLSVTNSTDFANVTLMQGARASLAGVGTVASNLHITTSNSVATTSGSIINNATVSGKAATLNVNNGGTTSGTSLTGGDSNAAGVENVYAGGIAHNTQVGRYGIQVVQGGTAISSYVSALGELDVNTGVASGALIDASGSANILAGGSGVGWSINSGGVTNVKSGGVIINSLANTGGKVSILTGGSAVAMPLTNGAHVLSNVTLSGGNAYVSSGGVATNINIATSAGKPFGNVIVSAGGSAVASGTVLSRVTVQSGGVLVVDGSITDNTLTTVMNASLQSGSYILFPELNKGNSSYTTTVVGNVLTVYSGGKAVANVTLGDSLYNGQGSEFIVQPSATGLMVQVCFLAGTMIETPNGAVAIENLSAGEMVYVWEGGKKVVAPIKWIGSKTQRVNRDERLEDAGYPVRIRKGAIGLNVPSEDLLITPEHCLFIDGCFVPVRMLVNGHSVFYDQSYDEYEYFHLETEKHSVLIANGTLTESYLDTGNRMTFESKALAELGNVIRIGSSQTRKNWERDAAAPLNTSREFVEPIYNKVLERACIREGVKPVLTEDAELVLETLQGRLIKPTRRINGRYVFMIPSTVDTVFLRSRTFRPSDTIGPFCDDRRSLGVLVGQVCLFDANSSVMLSEHREAAMLEGWYPIEHPDMRWTSGRAKLTLGDRVADSIGLLSVDVLSAGPYLAAEEEVSLQERRTR
ncbi:Hint domain-containing protein [Asaia sp. VD9]|uniref:Hint domain-containing protein n=1 Tax=Asaia sp. VD9 TaxID=3081235 RepID=UPI00301A495C